MGADHSTTIDHAAQIGLVQRCWLTHDAMWFANCIARLGIDVANDLNRAVVRDMAAVEAKRVAKLIALDAEPTHAEVHRFFDTAIALLIPAEVMSYDLTWEPDHSAVTFEVSRCFAHEGTTALGVVAGYQCGIFERIEGWMTALGVPYTMEPVVEHCTLHHDGWCHRTFRFT